MAKEKLTPAVKPAGEGGFKSGGYSTITTPPTDGTTNYKKEPKGSIMGKK